MRSRRSSSRPACRAAVGDSKSTDAAKALKNAIEEKDATKRQGDLAEAQRKAREAATQGTGAAGWIYLARAYLYGGDLVGADTAFARAEKIAPDCKEDTGRYREAAWVPLVNAGIDFANGNNPDSALVLFRQANSIYRDKPTGFAGVGTIYANQGNNDSAIVYLQKATEVATAAKLDEDRNVAAYNLGLVQTRAKKYEDAVKTLEQYRTWAPNDVQGAKALAVAYRGAGQADKAAALEKEAGIPPGEVPGAGAKAGELFQQGVAAFDAGNFAEAGELFGQVYAAQPYNHDALVNQATAYYKAKDRPSWWMPRRSWSRSSRSTRSGSSSSSRAIGSSKQADKQIEAAGKRLAMPLKIETKGVKLSPTEVELTLVATGRDRQERKRRGDSRQADRAGIRAAGGSGDAVLATQEVTVPPLKPDATHEVKVAAQANGITGWRYKVAS